VKRADTQPSGLCCSFCRKSQDSVSKLISSPSDYPRAYICDECIAVCASILEDGRDPLPAVSGTPVNVDEKHPLLVPLLSAIEHWIRHESLGVDAAHELGEVRKIAVEMMEQYPEKPHL
jgi:ATP-dependent protease Clp ATPase subunit